MAIINGANFGLLAYSQGKLWRVYLARYAVLQTQSHNYIISSV